MKSCLHVIQQKEERSSQQNHRIDSSFVYNLEFAELKFQSRFTSMLSVMNHEVNHEQTKYNINENDQNDSIKTLNGTANNLYSSQQDDNKAKEIPQTLDILRKKKKITKQDKLSKKMFLTHVIMKNSRLSSMQQCLSNLPTYIYRLIPSMQIYFLAGDIFVEIEDNLDKDRQDNLLFNEFRNILQVKKDNSQLELMIESVRPLKMLNQVIYQLENSQNQDNYNYAVLLRQHQNTIFIIQDLIQSVIDSYQDDPEALQILLQSREAFMMQEKEKIVNELALNDEFAIIGQLKLSFENRTTTVSNISITKLGIALIGGEESQLLEHFLRKGFFSLFNYASRRIIFETYAKIQQMNTTDKESINSLPEFVFEIPSFELFTLDNILIVCNCSITSKHVQYPSHLRFEENKFWFLNQIETIVIVRYKITLQHLETLLSIRQDQFSSSLLQSSNLKDSLEVCNMEYEIKSQIFLEKYYKERFEQLQNEKRVIQAQESAAMAIAKQIPCKYRLI